MFALFVYVCSHIASLLSLLLRATILFNALAHGPRLFIDDFFMHAEFVGNMMLELAESVMVHSNTENLRSKSILNPSNDGDNMTQPAKMPVRPLQQFECIFLFHCSCC